MKSIRLSLTVYVLGLLGVALGCALLLVYRSAQQTLEDKQKAAEQLILAQYRERCRDEEVHLDDSLLLRARSLARMVQLQLDWSQPDYRPLHLLGLLSAYASPNGYALAPTWLAEGLPRLPVYYEIHRRNRRRFTEIKLDGDRMLLPDSQSPDYYQINCSWGSSYRSPSLEGRSFPFDPRSFAPDHLVHWAFDDTWLDSQTRVRRVTLKASAARMVSIFEPPMPPAPEAGGNPPEGEASRPPGPAWPRPATGRRSFPSGPSIYIQYATETRQRDDALQAAADQRDAELKKLDDSTQDELTSLRHRLLAGTLGTFVAAIVGGFWLVRLGLAPLSRLGDAVSRISPKDFRLSFDGSRLPVELRPIVARLVDTLAMLQRAFAREKQATADISHELRTPLAALLTTTEFALRKPRSPEHYQELLEDCRLSAQQMNQAVDRLLTLARLDAGVDTLRLKPVDVGQLAEQCAALVRPLAEARGLNLTILRKDDGAIIADPDKLREVVNNLLHNAIQYNRPGGAVELVVARENGHLDVEVRDTGVGIPPAARELIFERFYRADPSRTGDGLHTGLGLAIVKEYVGLMGGSIAVESTEGQGSTFRVRLPSG
jgi:heavy metal sensor kinase